MNYKAKLHVQALAAQRGMTLIELTVVLLILIGLAGLLIPYVGSFTQKTHDSTNTSNLSDLNSAVGRYIAQSNTLPRNLETLITAATAAATGTGPACATQTAGGLFCALLDGNMFAPATYDASAADSIPLISLADKGGMKAVHDNDGTPANKTFNSGVDGATNLTGYTGGTGTKKLILATVAKGNSATIEEHLALALGGHASDYDATCYDYVAMGIGDHNSMINNTMASAPVHFPEDATKGPTDYYNHYLAILQVDKANSGNGMNGTPCSATTDKAKFVGVAMNVPPYPGSHLFGANQSLSYAYDNNSNK